MFQKIRPIYACLANSVFLVESRHTMRDHLVIGTRWQDPRCLSYWFGSFASPIIYSALLRIIIISKLVIGDLMATFQIKVTFGIRGNFKQAICHGASNGWEEPKDQDECLRSWRRGWWGWCWMRLGWYKRLRWRDSCITCTHPSRW